MNPLNRIHPLTLVFIVLPPLLAMLFVWARWPGPTIPPRQVQATVSNSDTNQFVQTTNRLVIEQRYEPPGAGPAFLKPFYEGGFSNLVLRLEIDGYVYESDFENKTNRAGIRYVGKVNEQRP